MESKGYSVNKNTSFLASKTKVLRPAKKQQQILKPKSQSSLNVYGNDIVYLLYPF